MCFINVYVTCAGFCLGHLIHSGLMLGYQIVYLTSEGNEFYNCASVATLILDVLYPIYSFFQLFFIFKYSHVSNKIFFTVILIHKYILNREKRSETYLTHVCRLSWSVACLEKIKKEEISASNMVFVSCRDMSQVCGIPFSPI